MTGDRAQPWPPAWCKGFPSTHKVLEGWSKNQLYQYLLGSLSKKIRVWSSHLQKYKITRSGWQKKKSGIFWSPPSDSDMLLGLRVSEVTFPCWGFHGMDGPVSPVLLGSPCFVKGILEGECWNNSCPALACQTLLTENRQVWSGEG